MKEFRIRYQAAWENPFDQVTHHQFDFELLELGRTFYLGANYHYWLKQLYSDLKIGETKRYKLVEVEDGE